MSFMRPEIVHMATYHVESQMGTEIVPADLVGDNPEREDLQSYCMVRLDDETQWERHEGFYCRFSAPGHMDVSDWHGPFGTERQATQELADIYNVCPRCWEPCWDSADGACDTPCKHCDSEESWVPTFCNHAHCAECFEALDPGHDDCGWDGSEHPSLGPSDNLPGAVWVAGSTGPDE